MELSPRPTPKFAAMFERTYPFLFWSLMAAIGVRLCLFGFFTLQTPEDRFSPDSMNYVDVAHNILSGRGIVQSCTGYNTPHFSVDLPLPQPLTSQPPLYPLLIALLGGLGIPLAKAALLIPIAGSGAVLAGCYLLVYTLYDEGKALAALAGLGFFAPLWFVSGYAWSETPGMGLVLFSLWLALLARRGSKQTNWKPLLAGLLAGLAFATRYSLLPVFALGTLVLIQPEDHRRTGRNLALYAAGCALPVLLVLGHNLRADGTLLGPARNPATTGLVEKSWDIFNVISGNYLGNSWMWGVTGGDFLGMKWDPTLQRLVFWFFIAAVVIGLLLQKKNR